MAVSPTEVHQYLLARGVSPVHAAGMVNNIKFESAFDPTAIGDNGQSLGLFQHYADRAEKLKAFAGGDWQDWRKQVDYALSEPDTQDYLANTFSSPAEASMWFTKNWERPANAESEAARRAQALSGGTLPPTITSALPPGGGMPAQAPETTAMPQGTLPPEFSPPEPTTLSNMAQNPWLQMGLGILASNNVGEGMQKGLLGAAAAEQTRERNRLWQQQINQAQASQMGMGRANEAERMRHQIATRQADLRERELQAQMSGVGGTPSARVQDAALLKQLNPEMTPKEIADRLYPEKGAKSKTGDVGMDALVDSALADFDELMLEMDKNPDMVRSFGSIGETSEKWWGVAGYVNDLTRGKVDPRGMARMAFGENPARIRRGIEKVTLPVIRTLVEPKGPISGMEQKAGARLLGMATRLEKKTQGFLEGKIGAEDAAEIWADTMELMREVKLARTGTTPPETTEALPSGGGRSPETIRREMEEIQRQIDAMPE